MRPIKIMITLLATVVMATALLSACGSSEAEKPEIQYIEKTSELQRGTYYTKSDKGFAETYQGDSSFSPKVHQNPDNERVVWFTDDDFGLIPTVKAGEQIIYCTDEEFDEEFYFERFFDLGYTIGICKLKETETGRFKFATKAREGCIHISSDAADLESLGDINVTLDAIGGRSLRSGSVSPAGTVVGLEKGKTYDVDLYVGTKLHPKELKADSRAMYSIEVNRGIDYEFLKDEIIAINIPEWFHSGYYSVNGSGIFRYIAEGDTWSEDLNMNALNGSDSQYQGYGNDGGDVIDVDKNVHVATAGPYQVNVYYGLEIASRYLNGNQVEEGTLPKATLEGNGKTYELKTLYNNNYSYGLRVEAELPEGDYVLHITDLYGRGYSYEFLFQGTIDFSKVREKDEAAQQESAAQTETTPETQAETQPETQAEETDE